MVQYTVGGINGCSTTNSSYYVGSGCTISDERSQIPAWLSPLEPKLQHREVQERRVDGVGEWLIQTEEFRRWRGLSGEGSCDEPVLFCHGGPGVGKTFIR